MTLPPASPASRAPLHRGCGEKMADLPADCLSTYPPLCYIGVDVCQVLDCHFLFELGELGNSKRWAVIFSCMSTWAIHIEVMELMASSSFINTLQWFLSIQDPVKWFRSDCGTNFLGTYKELSIDSRHWNNQTIQGFLNDTGCTWVFNTPHSSHMGGSWEHMICVTRCILVSNTNVF